jgi:hypothetical protein
MVIVNQMLPPLQAAQYRQVGGKGPFLPSESDDSPEITRSYFPVTHQHAKEPPKQVQDSFLAFSSKVVEDTNALIDPQGWVYIAKITTLGGALLRNRYTIDCTEGDPGMYLQKIRDEEREPGVQFEGYVMYAKEMRRALNAINASVEGNGLVERVWYAAKSNN